MVTGTNGQTGPPVTFLVVGDPSGADDAVNSLCLEEKTVLGRPYNYKIATPFHAQLMGCSRLGATGQRAA